MLRALRRRLAAWYLAILAGVLAAYGAGTFVLTCRTLAEGADRANRRLAEPVQTAFTLGGLGSAAAVVTGAPLGEGEHLQLLGPDGAVLGSRGPPLPPLPLVLGSWTAHGPLALQVLTVPLEDVGFVRAAHSLTVTNRALGALGVSLVVFIPLALAVAWFGGRWLAAKAVKPVEEAWERERQFTRDASHELRTPLSVLRARAELARGEAGLPPAALAHLAQVTATADKMARLVGDLLALTREDAGAAGRPVRFALEELVEEEVEALGPLAAERGVRLDVAPLPDGVEVHGDAGRLGRAVRNLVDNAIRYAGAGGRVWLSVAVAGRRATVRVRNTGVRISEADRERIFERFHRGDAGRQANPDGSGLGLAISRAIARAHGGELILVNPPGEETTFELRLPTSFTSVPYGEAAVASGGRETSEEAG